MEIPRPLEEISTTAAEYAEAVLNGDCRPLLPLIEHPYSVRSEFEALLSKKLIPDHHFLMEKYLEIVLSSALKFGGSHYWASLSVSWLESGAPLTSSIVEVMRTYEYPKNQQRLKHRIQRLLNSAGEI